MRERARAPAKINLRLRVHAREASGYHRIDTLFCALELSDEITVDIADGHGIALEVDGPDLGPVSENLAVRAAERFLAAAGIERSVAIRLRKRIPAAGGLGGGSSDAAAVLRAMARALPGMLTPEALATLGASLGSDVPFFLRGDPLAIGTGRGDLLRTAPDLPSVPVLLVFPPVPILTAAAYRWLDDDRAAAGYESPGDAAPPPAPATWEEAARTALNDFEPPVFGRHAELRLMRDVLADSDAFLALLSGSGSTLFGLFPDEEATEGAVAALRARAPEARLVLSRTAAR